MTKEEEKLFFYKIKPDLELIFNGYPQRHDLIGIMDFISNYSLIRPTIRHSFSNGTYKSVVYEVITFDKIKEFHPIFGTFNSPSDALAYAIEQCLYFIKNK